MLSRLSPTLLAAAMLGALVAVLLVPAVAPTAQAVEDAEAVEMITIERSVVIDRPRRAVFAYAADFLNDPDWRAEVNTMTVDGPRRIGAVYTEDSTLGLQQHWVTLTELTVWKPRRKVAAETLATSPYYLRSQRTFRRTSDGGTRLTYLLEYDAAMADAVFGFPVPPAFVEAGYGAIMRVYLNKLRSLLESGRDGA